jgi:hypothetical protein
MALLHHLRILLLTAIVAGLGAEAAKAGWITVKNDTKQVIVIQEVGGPLNRPIRGKCIKLQPGETYREFQLLAGSKNVVIYDSEVPNVPLIQDKLTWVKDDAKFEIQPDGATVKLVVGEEKVEPVKTLAPKK